MAEREHVRDLAGHMFALAVWARGRAVDFLDRTADLKALVAIAADVLVKWHKMNPFEPEL